MLVPYDPFGHRELNDLVDRILSGERLFYGRDLAEILGYDDDASFEKVVAAAIRACTALHMAVQDHFAVVFRPSDEGVYHDWTLSREACYLIVMQADLNRPQVTRAQRYFLRRVL